MKKKILSVITCFMLLTTLNIQVVQADEPVATRVQNLLSQMTLEEKVGQMLQPDTRSITPEQVKDNYIGSILSGGGASPTSGNSAQDWADRLDEYQEAAIAGYGIPLLYGVDAVHGHNNVDDATIFPHNIGLGQANDEDLVKRIGEITAKEMRATGANWTFTPTLGIPKNERWGRAYECFGENADLVKRLGDAYVRGSQGSLDGTSAIATGKHFIGEGITSNGVNQGNVPMDYNSSEFQAILHDELLVPYRKVIDSGVKSIMVSYNSINYVKCHGNYDLLTTLLKEELGFDGIVISDYNGIDQIEGNLSYKQQAIKSVNAGMDMIMVDGYQGNTPTWMVLKSAIIEGVNEGSIPMERIDDAVTRILTVKFEMGLMDDVTLGYSNADLLTKVGSGEHREVAREAVRKSLTLLKNSETQDGDSTLMLDLKDMNKLIVAGSAADDMGMQCGGWTISWQGATGNVTSGTTIYQGLRQNAKAGTTVDYSANGYFSGDYEAAIVVIGETPYAEYAGDRTAGELRLSDTDIQTIQRIKRDHPDLPIVVVLTVGRPITIANQLDDMDAVVMAGLPGSEGAGIADVLLGDYDFNGHLTMTWPWYAHDIEEKFTDPSKVLFEYGRGLQKSETTPIQTTSPQDPTIIDLEATNGIVEAEDFISKHPSIALENNGTSIGYFWEGYDITYRVKVPESARYTFTVNTATENASVDVAIDVYVDGKLFYSDSTPLTNTGGWALFRDLEMPEKISLPAGIHDIKMISRSRDFNVDYFKFIKFDDNYEEPEDIIEENIGTGALIQEGAVEVTMSSSDNSQSMSWYQGNQEIENKNSSKDALDIRNVDTSAQTTIAINADKEYQDVLGLGISIEESTVNNLMKMSDEARHAFLTRLLDPENGMGNSLIRVTIGTSDFTGQEFYTYYDGTGKELSGSPDWQNATGQGFSIQKDRDYGIIQVIKELQAVAEELGVEDDLRFFASSWTPPGWMKTATAASNSYPNNSLLLKGGRLNNDYIGDLAKYYVRFVEEYQKEGIPIYAMTLQNEPLLEIDYPSCYITGYQEADLAKAIKEELAASTVLNSSEKDIKVWAFDHNFDGAMNYVNELFSSAAGRDNVDGIAFHPYGGSATTMGALYDLYKEQYTMHLTERSVWGTQGAADIISWFRNGSESYNAWVTMLDSKIAPHQWVGTPDPTIFVQDVNNRDNYWATPEVYIMSQFSKYIRPGYVRIDSNSGSSSTVTNVAFKDPDTGKIILVVTNTSGVNQPFKVVLDGTQFNAILPAGNVATYMWDPVDSTNFKNITDELALEDATITGSGQIENGELGYIDNTTTLDYFVNVKEAGSYKVTFDVAAGGNWDIDLPVVVSQGNTELGRASIQRYVWWDAEWSTYSKIQTYVTFEEAGLQSFKLTFPEGGLNFKGVHFEKAEVIQSIPGILNAENYFQASGLVHEYGTPSNFGFINQGDYVDYKVNVQVAGTYDFDFEVATTDNSSGVLVDSLDEEGNVTPVGEVDFTSTGSTSTYEHTIKQLTLSEGEQTLRIKFKSGDTNFRNVVIGQGLKVEQDTLIEGELTGKGFTVELINATFVATLNKANWELINLPKGVEFDVERISNTEAKVTFTSEATVDFDIDRIVICNIDAEEFGGLTGTSVQGNIMITAIDDPEELIIDNPIAYDSQVVSLSIEGGTFNDDIVDAITLTGSVSKYVTISQIDRISTTEVELTLDWELMYGDTAGTIIVDPSGYDDGDLPLTIETVFKATDQMPTAVPVSGGQVTLSEDLAYRSEGTLKNDPAKGNYVDYYLDIAEAGNYVISYRINDDEAVSNALKISGGAGLATDNLMSISFGKFWGNPVGYRSMLTLAQGKQTLRFEINTAGFSVEEIRIEKCPDPIEVTNTSTKINVSDLVDGSKNDGWAIETKNNIMSIGCSGSGAYQDYQVDVKEAGIYTFSIESGGNSGSTPEAVLQALNGDGVVELGRVEAAKTGDWDTFVDSETVEVRLPVGKQTLRIYTDVDGFNYRSFTLNFIRALDVTPPVITGQSATVYKNNTLSIAEILELEINDDEDGVIDVTSDKVTITTDYDSSVVGIYNVTVQAKDAEGNSATETFTISVVNTATLIYDSTPILVGSTFDPLAGITVIDIDGSTIIENIDVIENTVDTTTAGTYQVVYQVIDGLGTPTTFTRPVEVKDKSGIIYPENPEETIDGENDGKVNISPTNDTTTIMPYIALLAVIAIVMGMLYQRKRKEV